MEIIDALGLMSGTSLDGLDLACTRFIWNQGWSYEILAAETFPYPESWKERLGGASQLSGHALHKEHLWFGEELGRISLDFLNRHELEVDVIGSHGHTVFHRPLEGCTFQLGHGQSLATEAGIPVVWDFRTKDVLLGGQGAPLVPIGDRLLFSDFDACLNLGGISNISFETEHGRVAFDICPINMALNYVAGRNGLEYDDGGILASRGSVDYNLLEQLEKLGYYEDLYPKSLSREWFEAEMMPLLDQIQSVEDLLATLCEHMSLRINSVLNTFDLKKVLITGGGAYNTFLMDKIIKGAERQCVLPPSQLIDFKEALVFAFLAILYLRGEDNVLSSVTGSAKDHCAGILSLP